MGPPSTTTTTTTTTTLRRSCVFCRSRKIRCSGETICSACQKRNLSCVYSPEAKKGRPKQKGIATPSPLASHLHPVNEQGTFPSSSGTGAEGAPRSDRARQPAAGSTPDFPVGDELERRFNIWFITYIGPRTGIVEDSISSYQRSSQQSREVAPTSFLPSYDGLLSFMACEMVGSLPLRFSHLGAHRLSSPYQNFYIASLAADPAMTMFDRIGHHTVHPMALGKHRILQLVDVWFSMHPLSSLVSKTLLTSDIQDDTVDEALLAMILAGAFEVQPNLGGFDENPNSDPHALAHFAASQLKQRSLSLTDPTILSTPQTMLLIGWRELSLGHTRRSTCFADYALRIISGVYVFWQGDKTRVRSRKLNGVDVGVVEQELVRNLYWLCFSVIAWASMQINLPFAPLTPEKTPDFPCSNEMESTILHLDSASGNISTLQAQVQAMRSLWPLSHITSTVAHVYLLYLDEPAEKRAAQSTPWQKQHLHQLHQLFQPSFDRYMLALRVRGMLLQAVELVKNEITTIPTQAFLLNAYHALTIHMVFAADRAGQQPRVSSSVIDSFCQSAFALLAITQQKPLRPTSPMPAPKADGLDGTHMTVFGLETCSRALLYIYSRYTQGSTEEQDTIAMRQDQLRSIADQLHQVCKDDSVLRLGSAISSVRKRFKYVKLAFQAALDSSPASTASPVPPLPSSIQDESNSWTFANDILDPGLGLGQTSSLLLDSASLGPLSALGPDTALAFPEPLTEIIDPSFFVGDPAAGTHLGFSGHVKTSMQQQIYTGLEELGPEPDPDFINLLSQGLCNNPTLH
ncbi:hypothetical protein BO71DRAFT_240081 [Aspergillus ellipticus CBS 707.79]|uniref:Zn(2)-C6 fungal-type domain-containing protein n=1 Tax=Aspergillus ellipticus CBS 707.79 TaxID=1448320 RepID=A0A319E0R3_9EURO|nr:hypothetical protein BO71DRAFT_240081 [Aspergillus ellipticus CBS 707.79]